MSGNQHFHVPGAMYLTNAAPVAGNNEIQTLTANPAAGSLTSGTFRLKLGGAISSALAFNATSSQVETALNNLVTIAAGGSAQLGVVVTGGQFPTTALTITFSGEYVRQVAGMPLLELVSSLGGGGSITIARTQTAVSGTHRGALPHSTLLRTGATPTTYRNTASLGATPNWVSI